jgi:hypothetical protein
LKDRERSREREREREREEEWNRVREGEKDIYKQRGGE